ncbi:hypothetical protein K461DRAFT_264518 [Myriangium duriaei CBS 260.36]|uniref:Glycosyl transferase CAP10 domain-containing protein n=1 Tax=Myriangium duriaei CBS 260.36 TaxID=1168546 RepID=A0A9P4J968_9PEZI|nr:hypothetical protein K461DRAFT_264518 [Myriangium duriaei CBS 260.36]
MAYRLRHALSPFSCLPFDQPTGGPWSRQKQTSPSSCSDGSRLYTDTTSPKDPRNADPLRPVHAYSPPSSLHSKSSFVYDYARHNRHHALSDDQCDAAFPHLFDVLDATAAVRKDSPIQPSEIQIDEDKCMVRVLIYEAELFIIQGNQNKKCWMGQWHERTTGLLHNIHRAISGAAPETIPDAEFVLDLDDDPQRTVENKRAKGYNATSVWGLTRQPNQTHIWLMPDYAYWAWPSALVGSHGQVRRKMEEMNTEWPWEKKLEKVVWRGTTHLNPVVREPLVAKTKDKTWADVRVCDIYDAETKKYCILQHEHCRYKFPVHTEGYTYSGRLKYLQLCNSAPIIHELKWAEHHTHLLQAQGSNQNFIQVKADWSDLEEKVTYYLDKDKEAIAIAQNSYNFFARKYLTPAATSCYWRRLIRSWASVQGFRPQLYKQDPDTGKYVLRGIPFEAYAINAEKPMPVID